MRCSLEIDTGWLGRQLSRTQVFAWNEAWSYADRARITAALDAVPKRVCVIPPSGGYIGVRMNGEEGGQRALVIYPGYLVWPGGRWTRDLPPDLFPEMECQHDVEWHLLSTFRPHSGGPTSEKTQAMAVCAGCRLALPLTGVCDYCS
jgi:hypothetical protein